MPEKQATSAVDPHENHGAFSLERIPVRLYRDMLSLLALAHVLFGKPASNFPGHPLELQEKPVDLYRIVIRHSCHNRPQCFAINAAPANVPSATFCRSYRMMDKIRADNNRSGATALDASQDQVRPLMISRLFRAGVLASLCVVALPDMASAQRMFDGSWSVLVVTEQGSCDRAYRYGISIRSGHVLYDGGVVNFTGRVAANGAVSVRVSSGNAFADGSGRLNRNAGRGRWSGRSGGGRCSGYWTAERRG
jgi:hypothetical protein